MVNYLKRPPARGACSFPASPTSMRPNSLVQKQWCCEEGRGRRSHLQAPDWQLSQRPRDIFAVTTISLAQHTQQSGQPLVWTMQGQGLSCPLASALSGIHKSPRSFQPSPHCPLAPTLSNLSDAGSKRPSPSREKHCRTFGLDWIFLCG